MTKCEVPQSFSWSPQIKVQLTHPREATLAFGSVTCFSIEYARPCEDLYNWYDTSLDSTGNAKLLIVRLSFSIVSLL